MSDFPQVAADGAESRTELLATTRRENPLAVNLLHGLALLPFAGDRALAAPLALALPAALRGEGFAHALLVPPPEPAPASLDMAGLEVRLLAVVALSPGEFERAARGEIDGVLAELGGRPEDRLLDARFELAPPPMSPRPDAATAVAGLGCLSEATDSPCPSCGGELKEDWLPDDPDPFLVCPACGWSRAQSTLQHVAPYQWALDRLRREFGADRVEFDARPGGEGVVVRVNLPERGPALVELRSPEFDINRLPDRGGALEEKLARVRDYARTGN